MRLRSLTAGLLALALVAGTASAQNKDEADLKKLPGDKDKELQLRINTAVGKAMEYLRSIQDSDGSWKGAWSKYAAPHNYPMGETAMALLALLKSGDNRFDEKIEKGFTWLRAQPLNKTYEVGTLLMALEARYSDNKPAPVDPKELTQVAKAKPPNIKQADLDWMRECVEFLLRIRVASQRQFGEDTGSAQAYMDVWHYPMGTGDHSNTQFALLGLKSASKCGIPIPEEVWIYTIKHFLEVQEKGGPEVRRMQLIEDKKGGYAIYKPMTAIPDHANGWGYGATIFPKAGSNDKVYATTGSMTCVGVSSLAIAVSELGAKCQGPLRSNAERAMNDGLAWLDNNWKIDGNPGHPENLWHYYYLYGLERTGVLTWSRAFGKHDWYREGAEYLLANQGGDGRWDDPKCPGPINNTCFALLFLTRGTVPGRSVITR